MRRFARVLFSLSLTTSIQVFGQEKSSFSLDECFQLAVKRSQTLAMSTDVLHQTEAQVDQARANFFPALSAELFHMRQDTPSDPLTQLIYPGTQSTAQITLFQNLFHGFKDIATLESKKLQVTSAQAARNQALVKLYADTARAFFNVLVGRADLKNYSKQIEAMEKRRRELLHSQKFGRSRELDVVSIDTTIANLEAMRIGMKGELVESQENLAQLTGLSEDVELDSDEKPLPELLPLDAYLSMREQRADLIQARESWLASQEAVKAARSDYFPSLSLQANYYLYRPYGLYEGIKWDTTLRLSFPLFSGGVTRAQVTEANALQSSRERTYLQKDQDAVRTIQTLYKIVGFDREHLKALERTKALAQRNYELLYRDNRRGLATNAAVLTGLTTLQEAQRNYDRTRLLAQFNYLKLQLEAAQNQLGALASALNQLSKDAP